MASNSASTNNERIILKSKSKNKDDCAICIDSLYKKTVAYLPCSHFFHHDCLSQAFEKQLYSCPLCRYDLVPALRQINFKFPVVNDPYVIRDAYFRNAYTYFRDAYTHDAYTHDAYTHDAYTHDAYTIYQDDILFNNDNFYDDMPDLVDSDELSEVDDNLSPWTGLLVHLMPDTLANSTTSTSASATSTSASATSASASATSTSASATSTSANVGEMEPEVVFRDVLIFYNI